MPNGFGVLKKQITMQLNEYLTVKEISIKYEISTRNIRRIIKTLTDSYSEATLFKDKNHQWRIHHLLVPKFKPQRVRKNKYYALSVDPCTNYTKQYIDTVMVFIFEQMNDDSLEINYAIEQKTSDGINHVHTFVKCSNKKNLISCFRLGFGKISYKQTPIFDLSGWKRYITKHGAEIITITK